MPRKARNSDNSEYVPSDEEDDDLEDDVADFVSSEDDEEVDEVSETKKSKRKKPKQTKRQSKKRSLDRIVASPRKQLSERKRSSRQSPSQTKDPSQPRPKAKKQKIQTPPTSQISITGSDAVQRVDAEIAKLPDVSKLNYSVMEQTTTGMGFAFRSNEIPEFHGQKTLPEGHPECLFGKTFVISGVLESLTREDAENLIKRHAGRVTSAVSGKTTFLVVGREAGRTKCEKATNVGTKFIDEEGLFQLIRAADISLFQTKAAEPSSARGISMEIDEQDRSKLPTGRNRIVLELVCDRAVDANVYLGQELWVDKYKPKELTDLVGNPSAIETLRDWLTNWRDIHIFGDSIYDDAPITRKKQSDDREKKAVLISGSPGIGKTSAALLVAKELEFDAIEVNASDTRNKADKAGKKGIAGKTSNRIKVLCQNHSIDPEYCSEGNRVVLIMDEVDGMSAGDRGGVADLIDNIKKSKIPIICICNDKYNRKLTSLKNHCMELDFKKPLKVQIKRRLDVICRNEGLSFSNPTVLETLIDQAHGDMRTLIGGLQFIRAKTSFVTYKDVESGKVSVFKNQDVSPFEATRQLLSPDGLRQSWRDRSNAVFNDMDLVPLLVQENYVNHVPTGVRNEQERLKELARAASYISFGERINAAVYSGQKWGLMPSFVHMGTLAPATIMRGRREVFSSYEPNFTRFTSYLGNLSTTNKQYRLLQSTSVRMASGSRWSIDKQAIVMDYFPLMRTMLTRPLIDDNADGVQEVCTFMKTYCIDKEHYDFVMDVSFFKSDAKWSEDPLKDIPSKVKAAMTRQANSAHITCPALGDVAAESTKATKSQPIAQESSTLVPDTGVIEDTVEEEEEEDETVNETAIEDMKQSGYRLQTIEPKSRKTKAAATKRTKTKKAKRGKGGT